jgi:hypothetical protein
MAVGNYCYNQNIYKSGPGPRTHKIIAIIISISLLLRLPFVLLLLLLKFITVIIIADQMCYFTIMLHFSDCDGSAIFRISSKNLAHCTNSYHIGRNLTCFRPVQSFDLLGWRSMSLGCSQTLLKSVA